MKWTASFVALATALVFAQSAQAHEHHRHHVWHRHAISRAFARHYSSRARFRHYVRAEYRYVRSDSNRRHDGGRPAAWCGWEMRRLVSSDPGPAFNLARNWARWGRSGSPAVGAIVVWAHHVGKIVGREDGMWVIESGNDGHRLRTRPRSIAAAIAIRWG